MWKEFKDFVMRGNVIDLAVAVIISSFVALRIVPAAASRFLRRDDGSIKVSRFKWIGEHFATAYERSLAVAIRHPFFVILLALVAAGGSYAAYTQLDKELVPSEDRGVVRIFASGPDGVGINYMDRQVVQIEDMLWPIVESGEATSLYTQVGQWDPNKAFMTLSLADWGQRYLLSWVGQRVLATLRAQLFQHLQALPLGYHDTHIIGVTISRVRSPSNTRTIPPEDLEEPRTIRS